MTLFKYKRYILIFTLIACTFSFDRVEAATLSVKPSQTETSVGNIISVQISVDTSGKVINNAESIVQFPKDFLEVVSFDKTSSVFSLWVEEPSFSNNIGQLTFNGGVPSPGFQGSNGKIISITFRAKKAGEASIIFSDSAVRENDGLGTDILSNKLGAKININSGVIIDQVKTNSAPVITSSSHPDQKAWYNKKDIDLSWTQPKNVTAVKTLLGSYPDSDPTVYYGSPITNKDIKNVEDGTLYFHVNYLADGVWSKTGHYKLQIDTIDPTDLRVGSRKDDTGKITLDIKANDSLSGIDHFAMMVNSDKTIIVRSETNGEASVEVPSLKLGENNISVTAFDRAGNKTETTLNVTNDFVTKLSIDSYPAKIRMNESIEVSGSAPYPYTDFRVSLKDNDNVVGIYKIKSDSYSKFYFKSQPISREGKYVLWVDMLKENDEISLSSQKVIIAVETPLLLQVGSYTIGLMKVLIPASILLILFLLIVLYGWYKFFNLYRKVKKESLEAKKMTSKSFEILHKDIVSHIAKLKKAESQRKLTAEEIEFLEKFQEELKDAENVINKEIGEITR